MKLIRFALVGGTVTLVFMGLTAVFTRLWGKQIGFFAAYPPALLLHYTLNKWWTFKNHRTDKSKQVSEYLIVALVAMAIQWVVYTVVVTWTPIPPLYAALISNVSQVAISFVGLDRLVFAKTANAR